MITLSKAGYESVTTYPPYPTSAFYPNDRHVNVLQVPRSAIIEELGIESVFVVEDGKAVRRDVKTGYGENGMIEVTEGLTDDDSVITVGQIGLKPDATVTVINMEADDEPAEDAPVDDAAPAEAVADGSDCCGV